MNENEKKRSYNSSNETREGRSTTSSGGRPSNRPPQPKSWQAGKSEAKAEKTPPPLPSRSPVLFSYLEISENQLQMIESMMRKRNWSLEYFVEMAGKRPEELNRKEATYWINCLNNTTKRT
jgi:hypothetical protein